VECGYKECNSYYNPCQQQNNNENFFQSFYTELLVESSSFDAHSLELWQALQPLLEYLLRQCGGQSNIRQDDGGCIHDDYDDDNDRDCHHDDKND
jgi:hypothetical protein